MMVCCMNVSSISHCMSSCCFYLLITCPLVFQGCRARGANNWNWKATAVILVLLACSTLPSADAVVFKNTATAPQAARECLLRKFNSTTSVERKVGQAA